MPKHYVEVDCRFDKDGILIPKRINWDDGRKWEIAKVLHTCDAPQHNHEGIRYTIKIGRAEKFLYREGSRWYVDYSP
ncbi:hypothetical protein [Anaerotruncus rubiinfantis]|uniref:hypothetical protein n=1 Tax=Anaerotruncus rubiinfantis TaxID=1720200 RepID=UPI001899F979|nr:hypothetical protein [Anaerotruncus rubiinfantis]NCB65202.1 hypothetical protein [Bacilli bacterium]